MTSKIHKVYIRDRISYKAFKTVVFIWPQVSALTPLKIG